MDQGWSAPPSADFSQKSQVVLTFFGGSAVKHESLFKELAKQYPNADIIGCSSAGEILGTHVLEDCLTVTAITFEKTETKTYLEKLESVDDSYQAGRNLMKKIDRNDLQHVMIFSEGIHMNGSDLVRGLTENLPEKVGLSGGLAGDGVSFHETFVVFNGEPVTKGVLALAFYGSHIRIGQGSKDGFSPFGPERLITKSKGNVLYELDGQSAVELYKRYLGEEKSKNLSTNQFFFPLSYRTEDMEKPIVRTILSIDEANDSMTFAGNIEEGGFARLMKTNVMKLIEGSEEAAYMTVDEMKSDTPELAILISCVGRKIILKQRVEEEVEAVKSQFKNGIALTGFYSYGEIAQFKFYGSCQLHNQTMTITTFKEC